MKFNKLFFIIRIAGSSQSIYSLEEDDKRNKKRIQFYNKDFVPTGSHEFEHAKIFFSDNGKYAIAQEYLKNKVTMIDNHGNILWEKEIPNTVSNAIISETGERIALFEGEEGMPKASGLLELYDSNGNLINRISDPETTHYSPLTAHFSNNEQYFIYFSRNITGRENLGDCTLIIANNNGKELWSKKFFQYPVAFAVSSDGSYVVAMLGDVAYDFRNKIKEGPNFFIYDS